MSDLSETYDAVIIGAGMSGLACGIRLAMFDKKVCILESHSIPGGLNSYYKRRLKSENETLKFDVGLHALTNFALKKNKKAPLVKMLRQLRIPYESLQLCEQSHSLIDFQSCSLKFSNDFHMLREEVERNFPKEIEGLDKLLAFIEDFNELDLKENDYISARSTLANFFKAPLLIEMILCPLLIYGSAWEHDMDLSQFIIMFKSIYLEGLSRPSGGVRTITSVLEERFKSLGGELKYRHEVSSIIAHPSGGVEKVITKKGEFKTKLVFSSAGLPETIALTSYGDSCEQDKSESNYYSEDKSTETYQVGAMTFMESIMVFDKKIETRHQDATLVFHNNSERYHYEKAKDFYDDRSAVICFPNNYNSHTNDDDTLDRGIARVTFMANYEKFKALDKESYLEKKEEAFNKALKLVESKLHNFDGELIFKDVFTPKTIERYTRHFRGTVYGSPDKVKDGKTKIKGLYIIGTDQGFLGIVGSLLSGISIGNLYGLMES